jgi:hypothetical protein
MEAIWVAAEMRARRCLCHSILPIEASWAWRTARSGRQQGEGGRHYQPREAYESDDPKGANPTDATKPFTFPT